MRCSSIVALCTVLLLPTVSQAQDQAPSRMFLDFVRRQAAELRAQGEMGTAWILAIRGRMRESREARARAMVLREASAAEMEEDRAWWDLLLASAGSPDTSREEHHAIRGFRQEVRFCRRARQRLDFHEERAGAFHRNGDRISRGIGRALGEERALVPLGY